MKNKVKNVEARDSLEIAESVGLLDVEDSALSSITGGCTPSCGGGTGPTTRDFSCMPPGENCP